MTFATTEAGDQCRLSSPIIKSLNREQVSVPKLVLNFNFVNPCKLSTAHEYCMYVCAVNIVIQIHKNFLNFQI